jgi:hypothetical protein
MAKCTKCEQRKGKRYCVALDDYLCTLCCGQLREKEIHCPQSCTYLEKHESYQEDRLIEKKQAQASKKLSPKDDILKDERMAWLAFHVEAPLMEYARRKESFTDRDALLSLEYAREKIEKDKGLIVIPDEKSLPRNEIGEAICQSVERCRYEKKIIIPGDQAIYKKDEKIKCLERIMLSVQFLSKGNLKGRIYLEQLINRFLKLKDLSKQKQIITKS